MIGILGGTFDPVHFGHLRPTLELMEYLELDEVRFIPCHIPPHRRTPFARSQDRLEMVELALTDQSGFVADQRELLRDGPSYSVDTLSSLRNEVGSARPLCLMMGMDAFASLPSWHRWQDILRLAHIIIAHRPGNPASHELEDWAQQSLTQDIKDLQNCAAGRVLFHPVTQMDISATTIRTLLHQGSSPRYLLPDNVLEYIYRNDLYQN